MDYLFSQWNKLQEKMRGKDVYLFLDYDGTLTPIVRTPKNAKLSLPAKEILKKLIKIPHVKLAIISGRTLDDIRGLVNLDHVVYVGNHGLQIEGSKIKFQVILPPDFIATLKKIKKQLAQRVAGFNGVFLEDKGLTLSFHYRLVEKKHISKVKVIFHEVIITCLVSDKIRIKEGKKVLEIRPPVEWDKGKVVLWLLSRYLFAAGNKNGVPVYIGDDTTDEDAFRVLRGKGMTVFVGNPEKKSAASYFVKNTKEVIDFLKRIAEFKSHDTSKCSTAI